MSMNGMRITLRQIATDARLNANCSPLLSGCNISSNSDLVVPLNILHMIVQ